MTLSLQRNPSARLVRAGVISGIAMLVLIAYSWPFVGPLASLCLPFVTHAARRHLWPDASKTLSIIWSLLAWAGLWLPGLLSVFIPVFARSQVGDGLQVSSVWLVIPLCAPESLTAVLLPALAAALICFGGLLGTIATRRGWPWVAGAWLAPWVHYLVFTQVAPEFLC